MTNVPVVNDGILYVNGLDLAWTADETISMAAGAARNSANVNDIVLASAVSINNTTNGANGLDTGSVANSTMYAVYLIGDSTGYQATAGIMSADFDSPLLPFGYDMYRRVGAVRTDGTADNLLFWQNGVGQSRSYYYDVGISELSGGSSTTYAEVDLATSVPPIATNVLFAVTYTPNGATDVAEFIPFGSTATTGVVRFGYGVAGAQVGMATIPCRLDSAIPKVEYKVTSGDALTLLVMGYEDRL